MIEFRQKDFTIPEGHYTGPKDQDELPGVLETVGKSALGGAILGGIVGKIDKNITTGKGALEGGKYGALAGIVLKLFINHLHKPMSTVKYQEVDKNIRREFGIYRIAGITMGDKIDKRASVDEKFSFNDRNVTKYKINISIYKDEVTLYTLGLTDSEIDKLSSILDYYCKKYYGMEYDSFLLNQKVNAYSVKIIFTNYQVISNFILEVSNALETKINLLDSEALVKGKLVFSEDEGDTGEERNFSLSAIDKRDVFKILTSTGRFNLKVDGDWKRSVSFSILDILLDFIKKADTRLKSAGNTSTPREDLNNYYLQEVLKKLHYIEGFNYTIADTKAQSNMSVLEGLFLVTTKKDSRDMKEIDDKCWKNLKLKINRADTGKAIVYTYNIQNKNEFEFIVKKLMSTGIVFNIFS